MDKETKDFLEGLLFGLNKRFDGFEEKMNGRFESIDKRFELVEKQAQENLEKLMQMSAEEFSRIREEIQAVQEETHNNSECLIKLEHGLQVRIESQDDEMRVLRDRVERVETPVGLSHSLDAA